MASLAWVLIIGAALIFIAVMALAWLAIRSRPGWLAKHRVVLWGGIVFPFVVLTVLLVYSATQSVSIAQRRAGRASHRGRRPSMVVARALSRRGRRTRLRDRERDPPAGRPTRRARARVGRRAAQLLGAESRGQARHDSRSRQPAGVHARQRRGISRPMRRVLRRTARADGAVRRHATAVGVRAVAQRAAPPRDRAPIARSNRHCASAIRCADRRRAARSAPISRTSAAALSIGAGTLPTDAAQLARWIASSQHIKPGNLMPAFREFTGDELAALAAYLASLR